MKRLLLTASLLILAGCETLAPKVEGPADLQAWEARRAWLQGIENWQLDGRVAIAAYGEGWNASVEWQQDGEHLKARFSGPLGVGSARIHGTPELLTVQTSDGEQFITGDPENDLYWHLGWTAPLDRMPYWVIGMPGPGSTPVIEVDGAGRLQSLQQGGWQVTYTDYLLLGDGSAMPRRIQMEREGVRIRLVVSKWQI